MVTTPARPLRVMAHAEAVTHRGVRSAGRCSSRGMVPRGPSWRGASSRRRESADSAGAAWPDACIPEGLQQLARRSAEADDVAAD